MNDTDPTENDTDERTRIELEDDHSDFDFFRTRTNQYDMLSGMVGLSVSCAPYLIHALMG